MPLTKLDFLEVLERMNTDTTRKGFDEIVDLALATLNTNAGGTGPQALYAGQIAADPGGREIVMNFVCASGAELSSFHIQQFEPAGTILTVTLEVLEDEGGLLATLLDAEVPDDGAAARIDFTFPEYVASQPVLIRATIVGDVDYAVDGFNCSLNEQSVPLSEMNGASSVIVNIP